MHDRLLSSATAPPLRVLADHRSGQKVPPRLPRPQHPALRATPEVARQRPFARPLPGQDHELAVSMTAACGGTVVVTLRGELDTRTLAQAMDVLYALVEAQVHRVVVDLAYLEFMAAVGARALLDAQMLLMRQGGSMALARAGFAVARVLQLTGTDQRVPVYGSVSGAVRGRVPIPSRAP